MMITSKFASVCKSCQRAVRPGDRVVWIKGERGVTHAACSAEGQAVVAAVAASRATDAEIDIPAPPGLTYLPYQRAGISYASQRARTLIADEMGLGKTIQALGMINATPEIRSVCVVCPKSVIRNWEREAGKWLVRQVAVTVTNYEQVKKLGEVAFDLVVLDEAHYIKNPKAQRTRAAQALAHRAKRCLVLTGTPVLNRPVELWPILQIVAPETFDPAGTIRGQSVAAGEGAGFFRFAKRYCDAHEEYRGRTKFWDFSGASNLAELQEKLRAACMVRRLKKDVLTELPTKVRQVIPVCNGVQAGEDFGDPGDDYETAITTTRRVAFEDLSRVRHEQAVRKVPAVLEHLENVLENTDKVVVFAHHHDVITALRDGLAAFGVAVIEGETSAADRASAVDRFQTEQACRVFLGSLGAASEGITLTAASHVIFAELDWVPAKLSQAEDRCHRIGQRSAVLVQHLVMAGSLDEKMARLVVEKQEVADAALDDEAVYEGSGEPMTVVTRADRLAKAGLTEEGIARIHARVRALAAVCDGAQSLDGSGFNKLDSNLGKSLATAPALSIGQALLARKILAKYTRQMEKLGPTHGECA